MPFDQGQFDFDTPGSDAGWRRWRQELEAQQRSFELRWGVVLGKRVSVSLINHTKPLCGLLEWIERDGTNPNSPPRFRLRGLEFGHDEIQSIVQEERNGSD